MLIVCPHCGTSYQIEPNSLGAGRSVRCVRCRNVWFAANTNAMSAISKAHREDLSRLKAPPVAGTGAYWPSSPDPPPITEPPQVAAPVIAAVEQSAPAADNAALPGEPLWPEPDAPADEPPRPSEPVLVADAPPLAPVDPGDAPPLDAGEDIETVAARRARRAARSRRRWPLAPWPTATLVQMLLVAALLGWRADVVQLMPQTASLYAALGLPVNLRGLDFTGVQTENETADGVQVLVIQGTIVSTAAHRVDVPRLRFAVRDAGGHEIYAWTALLNKKVLAPGEMLAFRSRLASPPPESRDISVRFFNRRDRIAGVQ
jgi:predicted Zn finger-like uncharacterized protein